MKARAIVAVCAILLCLMILPVNAPSTPRQAITVPVPVKAVPLLNMTLLSATINGCSQVANINATWTGTGYYAVAPSSFTLIIRSKNSVYANSTDIATPNNIVNLWYLFKNVPITLQVSFESCTNIASENLVYNDGVFLFVLH